MLNKVLSEGIYFFHYSVAFGVLFLVLLVYLIEGDERRVKKVLLLLAMAIVLLFQFLQQLSSAVVGYWLNC